MLKLPVGPSIFLAIILLLILTVPVFAQDDKPPLNSQDLVSAVVTVIAAVAALVSSALVNLIKTIPYLGDDDKDKVATAVTQIVSVAVSVATGYVTALVAQWLGLVDDLGTRTVIIAVLTPILSEARYRVAKLAPA